ncbi:MAG: hypothetical protein GX124_08325, partial [Clostridiales bacterium]|nr:hypothetical protein [Clostridiales bacterium]
MTTIEQLARQAEEDCREVFRRFEAVEAATTGRVLDAFESRRVEARHFTPSNGYGYGDLGRDTLEALAADIFRTPAAILRPQISGGTHTLALCLFGLLLPGDELLSATGKPYDTLTEAIGFKGEPGSLQELGVSYRQVELSPEGGLDTR